MVEQNWEYCELRLDSFVQRGTLLFPGKGDDYDCSIRYYALDGMHIKIDLSNSGKPLLYNPFSRAMAFLGANGWELVSVQSNDALHFGRKVAFLKRPIVTGRKVNEPELKF